MTMDRLEVVLGYHESTKHHPHRYARSLGYLDWATQPNPFRRYRGAPCVPLLLPSPSAEPAYDALYEPGTTASRPVCRETVSEFLQYSLALSAWKRYGESRWALRINPSSGNLHPTEGYLALGAVPGLTETPGVFHYAADEHVLERRCQIRSDTWDRLIDGFPDGTFLAGLASIHWREAWKYGERAYRYCQHDIGHALAAIALAAAVQGWQARLLDCSTDVEISAILGLDPVEGLDPAEREHPDLLLAVVPSSGTMPKTPPRRLPETELQTIARGAWLGRPNQLSVDHVRWELIDSASDACIKPSATELASATAPAQFPEPYPPNRPAAPARTIIYQRRSAVAMDGCTRLTANQFYLMMDRVLPQFDRPPWKAMGPPVHVHLALFVHLVEGLSPGLYFVVRAPDRLAELRAAMRTEFDWNRPAGCPEHLPLYHLTSGDARPAARQLSCNQEIASDGAFSLGMIAEFEGPLRRGGPWVYRRLFWETGMIGQVLYLEAEAAGVRGTGIGCFFDDEVHKLLGLKDIKYQTLYHFTVGGPVEDTRLTTLPPYPIDGQTTS